MGGLKKLWYKTQESKNYSSTCPAWVNFEVFRDWAIGAGYEEGLKCYKVDPAKGFVPENCYFSRGRCPITLDGQSRTVGEWAGHPDCSVSAKVIYERLADGWHPRRAIFAPLGPVKFTLNGVSMTLREWAYHPLCSVSLSTLKKRLRKGWTPQKAILTPNRVKSRRHPSPARLPSVESD